MNIKLKGKTGEGLGPFYNVHIAHKHMKLIIKKIQIKTTMRYLFMYLV